jgi:hypothetical protein
MRPPRQDDVLCPYIGGLAQGLKELVGATDSGVEENSGLSPTTTGGSV